MRFGVLGPVEIWDGDRRLAVGGPQQRALLAALLLNANRVMSADRLVEFLWGEQPPSTARALLQGCVAGLRRALRPGEAVTGQRLVSRAPGYLLRVGPEELDLDRFEELVRAAGRASAAGSRSGLDDAAGCLAEALSLWRGPALDGIDVEGCGAEAARLEERRLAVLEERIDLDLRREVHAGLVGELQVQVRAHPLRERLWALLMLALYLVDRQADALAAFQHLRRTLVDQLGVEPGATVRQVHRVILAGGDALGEYLRSRGAATSPGTPSAAAPAGRGGRPVSEPAAGAVPAQLPAAPAGFVGRERQLKRLDELLSGDYAGLRVVVISGMAGVGKTTLALHWAQRVRDRFPDGQLYVNLRGYASSSPVRPVAALAGFLQALGVPADQVPVEPEPAAGRYRSLLADRRVLAVLDNASAIEQVRPLLPGGPGCLVLVTSRERLAGLVALEGAAHLNLEVLDPAEAGELLGRVLGTERVEAEPAAVAELARWCGFLPLALRVAAANLALHPQRRIAAEAAELASGDRLAALAVDQDEQSAVRAAFDHSYTGLPAEARRLFRLLGLVPGPHVTADAAAALGGTSRAEASRLLNRLASAHLVDQPAPGRYTLHDLVRLYAADRAEHEETAEDRQAATGRLFDWYLQTADAAGRLLNPETLRLPPVEEAAPQPARFDDHQQALAWLDAQRPNLLAAVQHTAEHGPRPVAWRLADTLRGYYYLRVYTLDWLVVAGAGLAAAEAGEDLPAQAAAEHSLADLHRRIGRFQRAIEHYTRAATLSQQAGWREGQTSTLGGLGTTYFHLGRLPESAEHFTQALALARKHGQTTRQAARLGNLGLVYWLQGRLQQAADQHTQALALSRQLGSRRNEAVGLANLGESYHSLGRFDDALDCLTTALTLHRELGDRGGEAEALCVLAAVHRDAGRHPHALESAQAAVALSRDTGERPTEASAMAILATVHGCAAQYSQAIDHHQQALVLARETDTRYAEMTALIGLAVAYRQLANTGDAESFARNGLALAEQGGYRVVEGQAHTALAGVHLDLEEPDQAIEHAERAIAIQQETGHRLGEARARKELGNVLHRRGATEAAAASWQHANRIFTEIGSPEAAQPPR